MDPSEENFSEQKLRSFFTGNMGAKSLSRKEQDEIRKRQDEEEVSKVYREFVSDFDDNPQAKLNRTWVKAGTFNAGNRKEDFSEKGKLYKPGAKLEIPRDVKPDLQSLEAKRPDKLGKKKIQDKKKSNLEMFKEELKAMQQQRDERHRVKTMLKTTLSSPGPVPDFLQKSKDDRSSSVLGMETLGSHDTGDPTTTNLYLGNLSPKLTEKELMELFGKFGPLASIKIMWPRTEDEKSRGKNCGFVAYMSRKDGERALKALLGKEVDGFEMRMGWGKPVPIPLHPIYIPPNMVKLINPPEPSGLPFNCQPSDKVAEKFDYDRDNPPQKPDGNDQRAIDKLNQLIKQSKVIVSIPLDRGVLCLINRTIEFVLREGPVFEAMIMNREMNNPMFRFLFDNKCPEHTYYRWKMYSLLQGDTKDEWRQEEFRMFQGGSIWKPPSKNLFTAGMPDDLIEASESSDKPKEEREHKKKSEEKTHSSAPTAKQTKGLSESQRDRFEDMLRSLLPERNPIAETMVWCMEHAEAGEEIVECIGESLSLLQTPLLKKIARVYLISDILHNCSIKGVPNVSFFRKGFQVKLPEMFADLHACYSNIDSRIRAEAFKQRVMNCFRAWEDWALYPQDYLIQLQNIFLGLAGADRESVSCLSNFTDDGKSSKNGNDECDGKSFSGDDDVDGVPLDGAALLKKVSKGTRNRGNSDDSDIDGAPIKSDAAKTTSRTGLPAGFVPSKWETVDPEEVQAQAVTSKWDIFDQEDVKKTQAAQEDDDTDIDGVPMGDDDDDVLLDTRMTEDRRAKLREIELEVMRFQDSLESGKQQLKSGWTISEQVEQYRRKLTKQVTSDLNRQTSQSYAFTPRKDRAPSSDDDTRSRSSNKNKSKKRRRSGSGSKNRRRSSSGSRSRSRSRSRERKKSSNRRDRRDRGRRTSSSSSDELKSRRRKSRSPGGSSKKYKKKRY